MTMEDIKLLKCRDCRYITDVRREVAFKGWCPMWLEWQNLNAKSCKHGEISGKAAEYIRSHPQRKTFNQRYSSLKRK